MGEMRVMGRPGDTKIVWDPDNDAEVTNARRSFDELVGKSAGGRRRFRAYRVLEGGGQGVEIKEFDPQAGKIIIAAPMAGGEDEANLPVASALLGTYCKNLVAAGIGADTANEITLDAARKLHSGDLTLNADSEVVVR